MTYTVCVRTIVTLNKVPTFAPGFSEEAYNRVRDAAERTNRLVQLLNPTHGTPCPCKKSLIDSLHEEFESWASDVYIEKEDKAHHKTIGVSICFDDIKQAIQDGIPKDFIRDLGEKEKPRYEFFIPTNLEDTTVKGQGYAAQVENRLVVLKKLIKEKTPAPKLAGAA